MDTCDSIVTLGELELSEHCIDTRQIQKGICLISELIERAKAVTDPVPNGMDRLIANAALWMDTGWGGLDGFRAAQRLASRGSTGTPVHLACRYLAWAMYEFSREEVEKAARYFQRALEIFEDEHDFSAHEFYENLCHFYLARCERRRGKYRAAIDLMQRAMDLADQRGAVGLWAVMGYNMSRMLLQCGDRKAFQLLEQCRTILEPTDDGTAKAAINSILGRAARREGHYHEAVEFASNAIKLYQPYHPCHSSAARYHVDLAAAQRLLARRRAGELLRLDSEKRCVVDVEREVRRRMAAVRNRVGASAAKLDVWGLKNLESIFNESATREISFRFEQQREMVKREIATLRKGVAENLKAAQAIYDILASEKGHGLVAVYAGFLAIDEGNWELALQCARDAVQSGVQTRNPVLKLRAHVMWSIGAKACSDDDVSLPDFDYLAARHHAEQGIAIGPEASHNRLLARAHIALADVLASPPFQKIDEARKHCRMAEKLFEAGDRDWVTESLIDVRRKIQYSGSSEWRELKREIDDGLAKGAPMKDVIENFRAYVVVRVWREEDGKIERVKNRLHMNDQEIRAILQEHGLWEGGLTRVS